MTTSKTASSFTILLTTSLAACAPGAKAPSTVEAPNAAPAAEAQSSRVVSSSAERTALPPIPRMTELLALARQAAPNAKRAFIVGKGTNDLARVLHARDAVTQMIEERATDPEELATARTRQRFDVVIAPELENAAAARLLHTYGDVVVARWVDGEREVESAADGRRAASFTAQLPAGSAQSRPRFEHVLIERAGSAPLGIGAIAATIGMLPTEPFLRSAGDDLKPAGNVRLAGFLVRLPSGETFIDVPHGEQGATHVFTPGLDAMLNSLAGTKPSVSSDKPDPRSLAGALHTGPGMQGTRTSSVIVFLEGRLHLRTWAEAPAGAPASSGARTYELADAAIRATVTEDAWRRAFSKYDKQLKAKLAGAFQGNDLSRAELALERASQDLAKLAPDSPGMFEAVRFWERLRLAILELEGTTAAGGETTSTPLVEWTAKHFPDKTVDGELLGRAHPTDAEREAYRSMLVVPALTSERGFETALKSGQTKQACSLLAESDRLWKLSNAPSSYLRGFESAHSTDAKACGLSF